MIAITKERLLTIKQWRETYGPGSNVVLPAEEAEELARIALVSLEAKPIGAFHIAEQQVDGTSDYIKDGEWPIDNGTIEVYAAPPAPDVPAVLERLQSIVAAPRTLPRRKEWVSGQQYSYVLLENVEAMVDEACRAAMRKAGNSPVTPDGWISCSERMPDTKTAVLVAVEFDRKGDWRMKWATYIPGHPDANDGWIIPGASWKPSHWMPLPEPPQEVS
ncbi:DUF551 domain-containing protein [Escherichia coli]|uniref:DUF551 domain-containing protein n=1 Tax=Escherichia coli TaxID=562 RepID=UPI000AFDAEDA|nr:DUF551 domain-containing protein [Escherichia coli]EIM2942584.1 DUF551 domain-containing protein [Escherichia coli]